MTEWKTVSWQIEKHLRLSLRMDFPVSLFFKLRSLLVTCRINLVVAFGFSPQILGRWQGPTNGTTYHLPFYFIPFSRTLN